MDSYLTATKFWLNEQPIYAGRDSRGKPSIWFNVTQEKQVKACFNQIGKLLTTWQKYPTEMQLCNEDVNSSLHQQYDNIRTFIPNAEASHIIKVVLETYPDITDNIDTARGDSVFLAVVNRLNESYGFKIPQITKLEGEGRGFYGPPNLSNQIFTKLNRGLQPKPRTTPVGEYSAPSITKKQASVIISAAEEKFRGISKDPQDPLGRSSFINALINLNLLYVLNIGSVRVRADGNGFDVEPRLGSNLFNQIMQKLNHRQPAASNKSRAMNPRSLRYAPGPMPAQRPPQQPTQLDCFDFDLTIIKLHLNAQNLTLQARNIVENFQRYNMSNIANNTVLEALRNSNLPCVVSYGTNDRLIEKTLLDTGCLTKRDIRSRKIVKKSVPSSAGDSVEIRNNIYQTPKGPFVISTLVDPRSWAKLEGKNQQIILAAKLIKEAMPSVDIRTVTLTDDSLHNLKLCTKSNLNQMSIKMSSNKVLEPILANDTQCFNEKREQLLVLNRGGKNTPPVSSHNGLFSLAHTEQALNHQSHQSHQSLDVQIKQLEFRIDQAAASQNFKVAAELQKKLHRLEWRKVDKGKIHSRVTIR